MFIHRATAGLLHSIPRAGRLLLLCGLLGAPSLANAMFDYATNNGKIVITAYNGTDTDVVIPSTINGMTVTTIRTSAFYDALTVETISIPSTVTSIGSGAFSGCKNLATISVSSLNTTYSSVEGVLLDKSQTTLLNCPQGKLGSYTIPSSVTSVSNSAFADCVGLETVNIPNSVLTMGDSVFSGCFSLKSLTIPSSVTSLGYGAFDQCVSLAGIVIPNSVTSLGDGSFSGCTSLLSITIPNSITKIGTDTFHGCTSLASIVIPNSVTSIGDYTFFGCTNLSAITLPNSVTTIGYEAFYGCSSLANITLPNKIIVIGDNAFYGCTGLNSVTLPTTVTVIGNYSFAGCSNLTSIKIPLKVTTIGDYAFSGCSSLNSVIMSNLVTSIGDAAFSDCVSLPKITLSTKLPSIGANTFSGCTSLTTITFPSSVTSIDSYAFSGCTSLTNVTMTGHLRTIGNDAFSGCTSLAILSIPSSVNTIGDAAFSGCTSLMSIKFPSAVKTVGSSLFAGCSSLTNATLTSSIKTIEANAFSDCISLQSILIPSKVTSIGNNAFSGCSSLASITLPTSVTTIEDYAFQNCTSLASATLPANITTFGDYTFSGCTNLASIVIPNKVTVVGNSTFSGCTRLSSVTLGTAVASIGGDAFSGCASLAFITIPKSVTSLGFEAFANCTALTGVYFEGNAPSSVNDGVFSGDNNVKVYYRTGATSWTDTLGGVATVGATAPVIYQSPTNLFVQPGGTATFSVGAFGPLPISYQWLLNGSNISGARSATYTIKSVQSKNAGSYSVMVTSKYGSATSVAALLSVRPTALIVTPKTGSVVSNAVLAVQGTATGNMTSGSVLCRVEGGDWVTAQGTTAWMGQVTLTSGVNWVEAYAVDAAGNPSIVVSNKVTYIPSSKLTLNLSGTGSISGTVAAKTSGVATVAISRAVTLKAVPGAKQVFLGWSGWTNSGTPAISFVMPSSDMSLTAKFIASPYPVAATVYRGFIGSNNPFDTNAAGGFNITITSGGAYSAKLVFQHQSVSASGSLTFADGQSNVVSGQFTNVIGGRQVRVAFTLGLDLLGVATGSLKALDTGEEYSGLSGFKVENQALGLFNIVTEDKDTNAPSGHGYGSLAFSATGVKLNLTLPDEKASVTALALDRVSVGYVPFFAPLYGGRGFVSGWFHQNYQQISGISIYWHKDPGASTTFFNEGINKTMDVQGGVFTTTTNLASWGSGILSVDDIDFSGSLVDFQKESLSKGTLSIPVNDGTNALAPFKLTTTTGVVTWSLSGGSGTGILVPATAPTPGIYGFVTNTVSGVGTTHSVYVRPGATSGL